jgi:tetratricopeptide (TPR) repeat protein
MLVAASCTQLESLSGKQTENLRSWEREDTERKKLIVFVHGFNSNKGSAWGKFPELLKSDPDLDEYNIHLFGYPTQRCRQVNDIRDEGEYLASLLKETLPSYESITLVGHSMGGLVILHSLLTLERNYYSLLTDADVKVMTFGTPYFGVEGAELLSLLCDNKQANDMKVLGKELGRLNEEWKGRFNRKTGVGERDTPTIPVLAYRGERDNFVPQTSACGGPTESCEVVDGDHISIVKPITRDHLAYQKVKALAKKPRVRPTAKDRIGIWVSRIIGDDETRRVQRTLMERLEFYTLHEAALHDIVEVRELPSVIKGETFQEREQEAKRLGKHYNAAIVVSGQIAGLFKADEFEPRVTVVKDLGSTLKSKPLAPIHETQWLSPPPDTTSLPPQAINEPFQLARFLAALAFTEQEKWAEAAHQLEQSLTSGRPATSVRLADLYSYAGYAFYRHHARSGKIEYLRKAQKTLLKALSLYQAEEDWQHYADMQNSLGAMYWMLAERGVEPEQNLQLAREALQEAVRRYEAQQNWSEYARAKLNLGVTYRILAKRGAEPRQNLRRADEAIQEAGRRWKEQQDWEGYASAKGIQGLTYYALAYDLGVEPKHNLERSREALQEAAQRWKEQQNWEEYAGVQGNLANTYSTLAYYGVEPEQNYARAVEALQEPARRWKEQQNWSNYAGVQNNLGDLYRAMGENGINPEQNLGRSREALQEAAQRWKEQQNWSNYAGVQSNLGLLYRVLAERGIDSENNLARAVEALQEAARLWKEQQNWGGYANVQNSLGKTYRVLAERGIDSENNLGRAVEALLEAARRWKEQQNWASYAGAQDNLEATYRILGEREIEPEQNLQRAGQAKLEAERGRKDHTPGATMPEPPN